MEFKKGKYFKTISCMVAGLALLTTAAFANYDNASGYTNYKNAVKALPFEENFSCDLTASVDFDGMTLAKGDYTYKYNQNGDIKYSRTDNTTDENGKEYASINTLQSGFSVNENIHTDDQGNKNTNIYISKSSSDGKIVSDDNRQTVEKALNFAELIADTFVGDLKNNFVLTNEENGNKTYNITLTKNQVPEIVKSGMSLITSSIKEASEHNKNNIDNGNTVDDVIVSIMQGDKEPFISLAQCDLTIDENGKLTYNKGKVVLTGYDKDGAEHNMTLNIEAKIYDYGTTTTEGYDLSSIPPITLKDGSTITVEEMLNGDRRYNIRTGDNYIDVNPIDYSNYNGSAKITDDVYILNGVEVSNDDFYSEQRASKEAKKAISKIDNPTDEK